MLHTNPAYKVYTHIHLPSSLIWFIIWPTQIAKRFWTSSWSTATCPIMFAIIVKLVTVKCKSLIVNIHLSVYSCYCSLHYSLSWAVYQKFIPGCWTPKTERKKQKKERKEKLMTKTTCKFNMLLTSIFFLQTFDKSIHSPWSFWSRNGMTKSFTTESSMKGKKGGNVKQKLLIWNQNDQIN